MRERPILFSAPMVRAILDGSKTQTRRVVKGMALEWLSPDMFTPAFVASTGNDMCPYGKVGDRLWVKEAIRAWTFIDDDGPCVEYVADGHIHDDATWVWKRDYLPSMFMPRGLSRITLEITDVRVQRLQDLSEDDARAEGCERESSPEDCSDMDGILNAECGYFPSRSYVGGFENLWDSLNAKRAPWASNPWVWVVSFARLVPVARREG